MDLRLEIVIHTTAAQVDRQAHIDHHQCPAPRVVTDHHLVDAHGRLHHEAMEAEAEDEVEVVMEVIEATTGGRFLDLGPLGEADLGHTRLVLHQGVRLGDEEGAEEGIEDETHLH